MPNSRTEFPGLSGLEATHIKQSSSATPVAYRLAVSRYDRVASMLISLVALIGAAVLGLLIVWLSNQIFSGRVAVPVVLEEIGTGDGPLGDGNDLEMPSEEMIEQEEPMLQETLAAVADAVAAKQAVLADPALADEIESGGKSSGRRGGNGLGDGTGGRRRRWEVIFDKGNTLLGYARQLDFFGIELAVLMPDGKVEYAAKLSEPDPKRRTGPAKDEKRYYLTWRSGDLQQADAELLARAGIAANGQLVLKFIPAELEARLSAMEKARAGDEANNVRATRFGISPDASGYKFYVMDQTYEW